MKKEPKETPADLPVKKDNQVIQEDKPNMDKVDEVLEKIEEQEKVDSKTEKEVKTKPIKKDGKYYREKRKREAEEAEAEREKEREDSRKYIEGLLRFASQYLSDRKGQKWKMTPDELRLGSIAIGDLLEKYMPKMGDYAVEVTAAFWLSGYLGSRMSFKPTPPKKNDKNV